MERPRRGESILDINAEHIFGGIAFPQGSRLVVAVSGGSDSLALLSLLKSYLGQEATSKILAITVDHGLRQGSAEEAEQVGAFCRERDMDHRILRWDGEKPATGLPAASREARYRLLAEAATEAGASLILTGHTLNDQAETIAMRRERGAGRGLAGMAPATLYDGRQWIVRPLLGCLRSDLRGLLKRQDIEWIDDPSNEMANYERVAARRALAGPQEEEVLSTLVQQGQHSAADRIATGERAAEIIRRYATLASPGLVRLEPSFAQVNDGAAARLAFRMLIAAVGGREHLPEAGRARKIYEKLDGTAFRSTLGGAVIDLRKGGTAFLHRELRAGWTGAMAATPHAVWDGRYRILADGLPENGVVEALGPTLAAARARDRNGAPQPLMRAALAAEPLIHVRQSEKSHERSSPAAFASLLERLPAPWLRFLPSFDLEPARAVAELLECSPIPEPPLLSHNAA